MSAAPTSTAHATNTPGAPKPTAGTHTSPTHSEKARCSANEEVAAPAPKKTTLATQQKTARARWPPSPPAACVRVVKSGHHTS